MKIHGFYICLLVAFLAASCEVEYYGKEEEADDMVPMPVSLDAVAEILSQLPMQNGQLNEVYDAVSSSLSNGYDEEYTMRHLFGNPGAGVGEKDLRSADVYEKPLWKMIEEQVRSMAVTKASSYDPDTFLAALTESDFQIYWPYSEDWNGEDMPVITYDPEDGSEVNMGYRLVIEDDGSRHVEEVLVDEEMAKEMPVWVVNRNTDAGYTSLEMLRREDPDWGEGGGAIIVNPQNAGRQMTRSDSTLKTLVLKDFTMNRNYDSWFAGASEFFVLTITGRCSFA